MNVAGYGDAQIANAAIIADVARAWGLGERGALLGVMCAMGESSLQNIQYGDWETSGVRNPDGTPTTSIGLFQQQASWGSVPDRMDPVYAAWKFFDALAKVRGWRDMTPTLAIHRVQINADPNHYAKYEIAARAVLAAIPDLRTRGIIMADPFAIIEVPWQPGHYARRALVDAVARAGKPRGNSWGRLKGEQQRAWDRYQNGTGSPADDPSRPNVFPLAHVRFIAVDVDATAENVRRLLSVGLVRPYDYEPWHFQLPGDVRKWPLVEAVPAATTSKPFEEDDSMSAADVAELKAHINSQFSNFLQVPGAGYGYPQSTEQKVDALAAAVARVASGQILFSPDAPYYLGPSIANAAREGNDTAPVVQVTEESVVQAIAPLLPAHVGVLPDADLDRLITAASAERARRATPSGS